MNKLQHPPLVAIAELPSAATLPSEIALILVRFCQVRAATESLASPLSDEDMSLQAMSDASPVKWHLAHTSWFFETFILARFEVNFQPFDASFKTLFNSYYNGIGNKHPRHERGLISRPDVASVLAYRKNITARIADLIGAGELPIEAHELILLGCHHEEQHQELILTDVKYLLAKNPAKPAYQARWPLSTINTKKSEWISYQGGLVELGQNGDCAKTASFVFDNESPRHRVWLEPFQLASHPVSHGQYLTFIEAGGYQDPQWWLALGWDWVATNQITAPLYWEKINNQWHTFTLHGIAPIGRSTPICHINYFEADAFARWASKHLPACAGSRLPREAEWEHAASSVRPSGNFLASNVLHPLASQDEKNDVALAHPKQLFGDVWEWTQSSYTPYPGFIAAEGAVGEYNGKFMCNQYVLRGGSCATPKAHIRASYRNFFPPEVRWQFSGLRLARDVR